MHDIKISPSVLSADFGAFREATNALVAGGADYIHFDVMDGRFVPNITFGPEVLRALRQGIQVPFDTHLMIVEPDRLIGAFVGAGADMITIHPEACTHLHKVVHQIKDAGAKASVAINPATPIESVEWVLEDIDRVLVMTVNPGFGGQKFIPSSLAKIRALRDRADRAGLSFEIAVDGGIGPGNVRDVVEAGANVIIAGSSVFSNEGGVGAGIAALRVAALGDSAL